MTQTRIHVGTSGFSFDDWAGSVYPSRLPRSQWLIHYEQQLGFDALEINYTYYRMPEARTLQGLLKKTTKDFRFTIKTHRSLTHDILQGGAMADNPKAFEEFRQGIEPLVESGRLGCVLAQFPFGFANQPQTRDFLSVAMERFEGLPLVVEFRHQSWADPAVFELLKQRNVGLCAVDEPDLPRLMPWVGEATSEIGYVRFHGRNAEQWFGTSSTDRYNYLYTDPELQDLMAKSLDMAKKVKTLYVFFNNCHAGSAAKNAQKFKQLLIERGLLPKPAIPATLF